MEIELKLALPAQHAARIRKHPLLHDIKPARHALLSIYFDTPGFDLMQRGIALRVRRVGYHWVQTLKAEARAVGALSSRPEWEMAVAGGASPDFAVLPQAALDLLAGIDLQTIAPAFITEFQRTTWQIGRGEAQAELALDIGKIHAGDAHQDICEIEIELKSGAAEFLFDLATQLLAQAPLHIEPRSKAERGYILSGAIIPAPVKAARPEISAQQTAGEAWNAVMQAALVQCVANVPGFIENAHDTEYLHQLRIALRRLRTGVSLAKALGQTTPNWDQSLRETLCGLNPARDWDVFLHETLPRMLAALSATHDEEAMLGLLRAVAAQTRQQAQTLVLSTPFTQLILGIGRSLLEVPADASTPTAQAWMARQWAAKVLEKRWLILRKRCRNFAKLNPAERHMARIAAKKMRYAADAFAPLYPQGARRRAESLAALPPYESGLPLAGIRKAAEAATTPLYGKRGSRFIAALAKLQNALGRANDAHIGMQLLRALPKKSAAISFDLGRIDGALEFEAARHANVSVAIWRQLAQSRLFWR